MTAAAGRPEIPGDWPGVDAGDDARLDSPAARRNTPPILAQAAALLGGRAGPALEIGAGSGQHSAALRLAFPAIDWWPSDPDPAHRASIRAWAEASRVTPRALDLDAAGDWASDAAVTRLGPLSAVYCANVIHIAPWAVGEGVLRGAGRTLAPGGLLLLYGPFLEAGVPTGPGNRAFDADLRRRDAEWGLRSVEAVREAGAAAGLRFDRLIAMPADNRLLVLRQEGA